MYIIYVDIEISTPYPKFPPKNCTHSVIHIEPSRLKHVFEFDVHMSVHHDIFL